VRALVNSGRPADRALVDSGLLFLLRNKDGYGVWLSTQATVRVLDAILDAAGASPGGGNTGSAEIFLDGKVVAKIAMPEANRIAGPVSANLPAGIAPGRHRVTIRRAGGGQVSQVQLVTSYYVPWTADQSDASAPLRLKVGFDKTTAKPGDAVTCNVAVERVAFRGYGMMLAEIGLPPGADVDRQSLDTAMEASGWAFSHYDILPDRLVVYLWPQAGETSFSFKFRPRFAMQAKTAASVLYDYYNPEARVVMPPATFRVE
jgi:hypothetical protein